VILMAFMLSVVKLAVAIIRYGASVTVDANLIYSAHYTGVLLAVWLCLRQHSGWKHYVFGLFIRMCICVCLHAEHCC